MKRATRNIAMAGGALAIALGAAPALAQNTGAPTREEIEQGRPVPIAPSAPTRVTIEGGVERAPCPLADPRYANVTVRIDSVRFDHLAEVAPEQLDAAWRVYAGRTVPVATLCEIRDRAATMLRDMGYLAAIQIPPQKIETGGVVTFDVLMARLTAIQVRGDAGHSARLLAAMLSGLTKGQAFNAHEAERRLLLAGDLPGYNIRLVLRPAGGAPGEVVGEVLVTRQPVEVDVNIENYGSRAIGRVGGLARVQLNDITGLGDSTVLSLFDTAQTSEQTVAGISHSFALGADGLRFSGDFTYAWSQPAVGTDKLHSRTLIADAGLSYPLVRRQTKTVTGAFGLELVNQKVSFGGTPLSTDKLRDLTLKIGADLVDPASLSGVGGYSLAEPRWRLGGTLELRQGLSILGASDACGPGYARCLPPHTPLSRVDADPTPFIIRFTGSAEFRPFSKLTFVLQPRAQYSSSVLLNYEEIGAGNYTIGRGYDPGSLLGDSGVGFTAEARWGSVVPHSANDWAVQPYVFLDQAWSWVNAAGPLTHDPEKLTSVGGGLRAAWGNHARFDLGLAAPLRRAPLEQHRGDVRLLFTITTRLFPWRLP
jgi:hemolysin activation/secretion protein